jgi:hypothetical protein
VATATGTFSSTSFVTLRTESYIQFREASNNRTMVRTDVYIDVSGSSASSANVSVSVSLAGVSTSANLGYVSYTTGSHLVIGGHDVWITHNDNGVLERADFNASATSSGWGSASNSGSVTGFTDYDRRPGPPTFSSITRTTNSIAVVLVAGGSPAGPSTVYTERNTNGGGWGDQKAGLNVTFTPLALGSSHVFKSFAINSDGQSSVITSATYDIPNVPTAPSITTTAPSGRALNVSSGVSTANGATVTGYFVQLSPDDGVTWETAISIPSRAYRFEDLAGGTNVKFRVYSQNEMGFSAFTVTDSIFIPSGGRRLTPDGFISTQTFTRLTASGPVPVGIARRLTASGWVELS